MSRPTPCQPLGSWRLQETLACLLVVSGDECQNPSSCGSSSSNRRSHHTGNPLNFGLPFLKSLSKTSYSRVRISSHVPFVSISSGSHPGRARSYVLPWLPTEQIELIFPKKGCLRQRVARILTEPLRPGRAWLCCREAHGWHRRSSPSGNRPVAAVPLRATGQVESAG